MNKITPIALISSENTYFEKGLVSTGAHKN